MYIDLSAKQILAAERAGEKIAVEIKSFIGASNISEFHTAIGQFFNYHVALEEQPERVFNLAVFCCKTANTLLENLLLLMMCDRRNARTESI